MGLRPITATGAAIDPEDFSADSLSQLLSRRNSALLRLTELELEIETWLGAAAIRVAGGPEMKLPPLTKRLGRRLARM